MSDNDPLPSPPSSPSPSPGPGILDLPNEILLHVFEIGQKLPHRDSHAPGNMRFEVAVSQVSRRWRGLAVHSPTLWTKLTFWDFGIFTNTFVYLERAHDQPLDIELDLTHYKANTPPRAQSMAHPHYRGDHLMRALEILAPHIAQWASFSFMTLEPLIMEFTLMYLSTKPAVPKLASLTLAIRRPNDRTFSPLSPEISPCILFHGSTPMLRTLSLENVCLDWDSRLFCDLNSLYLKGHDKLSRPSFSAFEKILENSNLETLTLSGTSPRPLGDDFPTGPPINLFALRHLTLEDIEYANASRLMKRVAVPSLTILQLRLQDPYGEDSLFTTEEVRQFLTQLGKPYPGSNKSVLTSVEVLYLDNVAWHELLFTRHLLQDLVNLRVLALNFADESMLGLLGDKDYALPEYFERPRKKVPMYCPELRILIVGHLRADDTLELIRHRESLQLPLMKLVFPRRVALSEADVEEFEEHLFVDRLPDDDGNGHAVPSPYLDVNLEHYWEESYALAMYENGEGAEDKDSGGRDDKKDNHTLAGETEAEIVSSTSLQ